MQQIQLAFNPLIFSMLTDLANLIDTVTLVGKGIYVPRQLS